MTDPITDMFVRIKNAQAVDKKTVAFPFSRLKQEVAKVLKNEKFIDDFSRKGRGVNKRIEITLSYRDGLARITNFRRRSKPGQREYLGYRKLFPIKSGYGIAVISTSRGVMSNRETKKNKLGGEVLVEVW